MGKLRQQYQLQYQQWGLRLHHLQLHQDDSYLKQEINIETLASGGIFKTTRASSKPARQIWSGIIAHPKGTISFTKSVEIVEKI